MLIHIVKTGETIERIASSYHISRNDLIANNLHITDFSHLKSGMKVKIPILSKEIVETLEETEAFVDDYYPSFEKFSNNNTNITKSIFPDDNVEGLEVKNCDSFSADKVVIEEVEVNNLDNLKSIEEVTDDFTIKNFEIPKPIEVGSNKVEAIRTEKNIVSKTNSSTQSPINNSYAYYFGNIIPKIDEKFIRKI